MTTQPFAVWSSMTLLRTAPPSAATSRHDERGLVARDRRLDRDPRADARACSASAYAARFAAMNWSRRRPSRSSGAREVVEQVEVELVPRPLVRDRDVGRTGAGLAPDRDPHEQEQQRDDDQRDDERHGYATSSMRLRELDVDRGEPAGVVRGERDPHATPAHVEIGMMVGGLGEEADPHDERDRVGERRAARTSFRSRSPARAQPGQRGERGRDLGFGELRHAAHRTPFNPSRPRWATLARCRSTFPTPKPRPTSSSTAPPASPCTGPTAPSRTSGSRSCAATARAPNAGACASRVASSGPKPRSLAPAHRDRRRARSAAGASRSTGATATAPGSSPGASSARGRRPSAATGGVIRR